MQNSMIKLKYNEPFLPFEIIITHVLPVNYIIKSAICKSLLVNIKITLPIS